MYPLFNRDTKLAEIKNLIYKGPRLEIKFKTIEFKAPKYLGLYVFSNSK